MRVIVVPALFGLRLIAALCFHGLAYAARQLACLGEEVAYLERELRLLDEIGGGPAVFGDTRIDLHGERLGLRHAAGGQPRTIRAWRDERTAAAKAATLHFATAAGGPTRIAQVPNEPIHPSFRRER